MIIGIEHTAIASPDPRKLAQWYVETLGFTINYDSGRTFFIKAANGSMIEIISSEGELRPITLRDTGLRHLALAVSDFDAVYGQLKTRNVNFLVEATDNKGVKTAFFTDPDGNILHIIQRETPLP